MSKSKKGEYMEGDNETEMRNGVLYIVGSGFCKCPNCGQWTESYDHETKTCPHCF
jgi:Zn finger protein HypA/HybF involved in hydrogenase expression